MIIIKSHREIKLMAKAGAIVAKALEEVEKNIRPGITTAELDKIAEDFIVSQGAFLRLKGIRVIQQLYVHQ